MQVFDTSGKLQTSGGGSISATITSNALSALSQQVSVLSQAHSVLSQAVSVLSQAHSVLSQQVSVLSSIVSAQSVTLGARIDTQSQSISVLSQQVSVLSQKTSSVGAWFVRGLSGLVSGTSTVNLAADAVGFWNPTDKSIHTMVSVATVVNNVGAGTANNGQDQAGAFTSSTWIHVYFVLDGVTVKTRSSLTTPANGPTLQGTESAWAYAGAVRRDASNNLVAIRIRGAWHLYDDYMTILANGAATTNTSFSTATVVPPNATTIHFYADLRVSTALNGTGNPYVLIGVAAGGVGTAVTLSKPTATSIDIKSITAILSNVSQTLWYVITEVGDGSDTTTLNVQMMGYRIPNGGE